MIYILKRTTANRITLYRGMTCDVPTTEQARQFPSWSAAVTAMDLLASDWEIARLEDERGREK